MKKVSIVNSRKKRMAKERREARGANLPIMSGSTMSSHYIERSLERHGSLSPFNRRQIEEMINRGDAKMVVSGRKAKIILPSGAVIIVSKNFYKNRKIGRAVTFLP